ncbi:LysR family transcriptional regulator [Streptococcus macacae]|uniref:LysR substrate binding domain protein n=1 Tax=Streptococcus macacae NCTC 11558 TaxID=764298 RepID=G5JVT5_9STRE|nr:LysR family transcriptional regulator [Streptococcus macacae]EHJ53157.1 LysR substrate binding domain protein [Streptococcus macacae NCTC 11558]SUN78927.1 LysR family transcriptional regulator [Streptococcus macacae NCTC 11558]
MNVRDLEYFYQLSQLHSFTAVAQSFKVSQPSVTYAVKRLEKQFSCDLFIKDPSHRSVILTQQGQILAQHAETILLELSISEKEIKRVSQKKVKVGFPPIIRARILSQMIEQGNDLSFMSSISIFGDGSNDLLQQLLAGDLDFSLIGSLHSLEHPKLVTKELYQRQFYIVVSEKHPFAKRKELSFKDVLQENFILLDEGHIHLDAFNYLNEKYHDEAAILFKLSELSVIGQLVKENLGITFLTDFVLFSDFEGLVKIPLVNEEKLSFHVSYAYPKRAVLSTVIKDLINRLEKLNGENGL